MSEMLDDLSLSLHCFSASMSPADGTHDIVSKRGDTKTFLAICITYTVQLKKLRYILGKNINFNKICLKKEVGFICLFGEHENSNHFDHFKDNNNIQHTSNIQLSIMLNVRICFTVWPDVYATVLGKALDPTISTY